MKRIVLIFSIFCLSSTVLFAGWFSKSNSDKVIIKGSTTVLPIAQKCAEAFRKVDSNITLSISGSGSGDGIKAIIEGSCDIANASRDMKDSEKSAAATAGKKIEKHVVAIDMITPIVHPSNKIKNLTIDQLKAIYKGEIKNWKELGGQDMNIVVVSRDSSSGTFEVWEEKVMKGTKVLPAALLQASNGAVVSTVANNPKAIGYIGFGYLNSSINGVSVNSIEPSLENGKAGKFPLSRELYMFTDRNTASKSAMKFINFVKSSEGQKLVSESGFIGLK
ncbi:MAG: phosphate ABC transporter substrate-binding protein [Spirochaetes bacterium]|nr:phosphate ABC transporter substrate-binding protein [Spirochaetota bacterium]